MKARLIRLLRRRSNAGRSARLMARQLRWHQRRLAAKWGAVGAVVAAITAGPLLGGGVVGSSVAALLAGAPVAVWVARRPTGAQRWLQGAEAEERTGRLLRPLERDGWLIKHDLGIKGSKANLDHLAIHPSGKFAVYIDTKAWHSRGAVIRWDRKRLMYGRFDKTSSLRTVEWEASKAHEVLGIPVMSVVCIDGGNVKGAIVQNNHATPGPSGFLQIDDMHVVESEILVQTLESIRGGPHNPRALRHLARAVDHGLPQK